MMPDAHSQTSYRNLCKIKSQKVLPWWQNIPLTDYKPKQHILFRINTSNDYKVSIILYVGEIKKMHKILYYIDIKIGYVVE